MKHEHAANTIDEAVRLAICEHIADESPDHVLRIETHRSSVHIASTSCEMNFDIGKQLQLTRTRWTKLVREYVSAPRLQTFLEDSQSILAGESRRGAATASMLFRDQLRLERKHRWGGCLMCATFNICANQIPRLTLYSRTSYQGYMGWMDAALGHTLARHICEAFKGITPRDIAFSWVLSNQQVHYFKSIPYMFTDDYFRDLLLGRKDLNTPWVKHARRWVRKFQESWDRHGEAMPDHDKFGPLRRTKRRWMEHKLGISRPSLPVSQLGLEAASQER